MTDRRAFAAILACALGATVSSAGEPDVPSVRARESMSQRLVISGSPSKPQIETVQTHSLRASFDVPADPTITIALTESSPVSLRLGGLAFDAVLGDDPAWTPFRRSATFTLPAAAGAPAGQPRATLRLRWTARHVSARARGPAAAILRSIAPAEGATRIAMPAEASLTLGDGSWFFLGTANGRALVRTRTYRGETSDVVRARVAFAGQAADGSADRVAPFVHVDLPAADSVELATPIRVKGTAGDDRGIARIFWSLSGGAETEAAFTADSTGGGFGGEFGTFEFEAPVPGEGTWTLRVRAVDVGGNSTFHDVPFVHRLLKSTALATGGDSSFVVRDGAVLAWGSDGSGQLGDGPGVVRIASGHASRHLLAQRSDDTVLGWGSYTTGVPVRYDTTGEVWHPRPEPIGL